MANTYKIIGTAMILILIRHGATRFDYSVMLSPSSQALDGYRSKLSRNFQIVKYGKLHFKRTSISNQLNDFNVIKQS